ncbi:hypothetical protein K503DRAFT_329982 [Rhizopogon vinicolor AM-OR11-026]|uniref:Uncharacterized protein n=1 Tax=Rhizopogon vinicolor AM-OR11-026 TaxID=1314800 RepID=A0A1B7MTZ7_9AGAM|nr:hypothetical protein K503DRAFT_329982 [Rhizopogon vinicolor AM-OR11-026]
MIAVAFVFFANHTNRELARNYTTFAFQSSSTAVAFCKISHDVKRAAICLYERELLNLSVITQTISSMSSPTSPEPTASFHYSLQQTSTGWHEPKKLKRIDSERNEKLHAAFVLNMMDWRLISLTSSEVSKDERTHGRHYRRSTKGKRVSSAQELTLCP